MTKTLSYGEVTAILESGAFHELGPAAQTGVRYRHRAVSLSSGGPLKILAAIEHPAVIAKILAHLGLPIRAPPPLTGAAIRSTPNGLIPNQYPILSGSAPEPTTPLALTRARR